MAKKQNANVQNVSIEQNAEAQKPEVQNAPQVVTLEVVKNEANDSGKTAPATIADVRKAFAVDVEKIRKAFK